MTLRNVLFVVSILGAASVAYAQSAFFGAASGITITTTPEHPGANAHVHLAAASPAINLDRSDITWYADNAAIAQGAGVKEADIITGPLGSETRVLVVAQSADGTSVSGEAFIRPTEVDLLWESDSYVPPLYRGRALPSAGGALRVEAVARFETPDGAAVPDSDIIYTWRRNGSVQQSESGRGKSSAILPAPALFGTDTISVDAVSADGALSGSASASVPSTEPLLMLYEDHPLYGLMMHQALLAQTSISDSEMAFAAVPYFAPVQSPNDPRLNYAWQVNGTNVPPDGTQPNEITINADKSNGLAQVALALTRAADWSMNAKGVWSISFSAAGIAPGADPFRTTQ